MSLVENFPFSSLPLVVMSILKEIQSSINCVDTARGRTFKRLEELLKMILASINYIVY